VRAGYFQRVLDRVQALPGVTTAAIANYTPITRPGFNVRFAIEGRSPTEAGDVTTAPLATVSPSFFAALRIPLLRGRLFSGDDVETSSPVVLVNAAFVRQFFGATDPVGRRIRVLLADASPWRTIIGVVGDVRSAHLEEGPASTLYAPLVQDPEGSTLLVRTAREPALAAPLVREALAAIDPNQAVSQVRPLDDVIADARSPSRFRASVVSFFAMLALVLVAVGAYGVMSSVMTQATTEWGIRLALGADPRRLLIAATARQLVPVMVGIGAGIFGCIASARLIRSFTFEFSSIDPLSLTAATTAVLAVSMLAT
jgi:putative ABC transport system permease protein